MKIASFNIWNTFFLISILSFGIYPLIPETYESYAPIMFVVSSFTLFIFGNKNYRPVFLRPLIIMSSVFIIFFISSSLSENLSQGFKKIGTMSSLIAVPIACFWFLGNTKQNLVRVEALFMNMFFVSNVIFSLIAFYLLGFYRNPKFPTKEASFFRSAIANIPFIGDHSLYISLFLGIAIIIGVLIYQRINFGIMFKLGLIFGQITIVTLLLLLMSKGFIVGLIVSLIGLLLFTQRISKKTIAGITLIIALGIIFIISMVLMP